MIYAKLSDAGKYLGLNPNLDRALQLLTPEFLGSVGTVRQSIDGDRLYVTRFDVQTSTDDKRLFEHHSRYLDIFTLADGEERVDIATPEKLTLLEQHDDYWGCKGAAEQGIILTPGSFLVLFPGDAHRPGMAVTEPKNISRIVFKVLTKEN